ncbi:MAG: 16S rRNA processing protein RimM [Bacteroidia bacterium]
MIDCTWVGIITGNYGVKGQLKVVLDTDIKNLEKGTWLFLEIQKKPVPFFIEETLGQEKGYVVKLKGIDTPEQGRDYYNQRVGVLNDQIIESESNDLFQLIDYMIIDAETNMKIGTIADVYDNSAHFLAKVIVGEAELLIPLHNELIVEINEGNKEITLQLPEGLIDL